MLTPLQWGSGEMVLMRGPYTQIEGFPVVHPEDEPEPGTAEIPADSERRQDTAPVPEILDWEACLENPPPRPSGTIQVHLRYRGRDKPIPVDEPE